METRRSYFAFYETFLNQLENLDEAMQLKFYRAITTYGLRGIEPEFTGIEMALWQGIKEAIDNQRAKSSENKERIKKCRENKKSENTDTNCNEVKQNEMLQDDVKQNEIHEEEYEYEYEKEKELENSENSNEFSKKTSSSKPSKHKHGSYNNVLLTDKELVQLKERFKADTEPIINNFSELKAMKGYTYKSDYLAILKWGADAYYTTHKDKGAVQNPVQNQKICASCGEKYIGLSCPVCGFPSIYEKDMQMLTGFQLVKEKYPKESWVAKARVIFGFQDEEGRKQAINGLLGRA